MLDFFEIHGIILPVLVLLAPLISFFVLLALPMDHRKTGILATIVQGLTFTLALLLALDIIWTGDEYYQLDWLKIGSEVLLSAGFHLDMLTAILLLVVTFISFLVNLFSIGYMAGDPSYKRYFGLLALFTFSMMGVVVADNVLLLFMFWELVGFSSYLLIGFWFGSSSAARAANKAFIANRIGDLGFLVAIVVLWDQYDTLNFIALQNAPTIAPFWSNVIGIGLLCGAIGKSAQFPLQVWLPDAMEGPTPVSALIHAATMVVAGVFLLVRTYALLSADVLSVIALIGAVTAFVGAVAAINQYDIKKVLAFSTISQLGYMIAGIGVGATGGAIFHLVTHAFFKACLFLSAGAVIYWMHQVDVSADAQDMRTMGGIRRKLPLVFIPFLLSALSLAGLPFFSGFLSKDAILAGVWEWTFTGRGGEAFIVAMLMFGTVALTGYYMARQVMLVFFGTSRSEAVRLAQNRYIPISMLVPLLLLVTGVVWILFALNPFGSSDSWIMMTFGSDFERQITHRLHMIISLLASLLASIGILSGYYKFRKHGRKNELTKIESVFNKVSANHWYLDHIYDTLLIRPVLTFSRWVSFLDRNIVDRLVDYFGVFNVVLSKATAWGDKHLVDGIVHFTTLSTFRLGRSAEEVQGNQVQQYILVAISMAAILIVIIAVFF